MNLTMDRDEMPAVTDRLKSARRLDVSPRVWDRFVDLASERLSQVAGGTRRAGKVTLSATIALDSDGIPCVKLTLDDGSKEVGVWNSAEGGQLTLEGL